jgi:hypothetical protein
MTLIEAIVVIGVLALFVVMIFPALQNPYHHHGPHCINNLHQINLAFKVWEGDNGGKFQPQIYATNVFGLKLMNSGNSYLMWRMLSNELITPIVLRCPEDAGRTYATNFTTGFSDANISYFFSLDASDTYPQMILDGDDNLAVNGTRVKPGIWGLPSTNSLTWTKERHRGIGIIGMADGSVQQTTSNTLNSLVIAATNGTPVAAPRWVIP